VADDDTYRRNRASGNPTTSRKGGAANGTGSGSSAGGSGSGSGGIPKLLAGRPRASTTGGPPPHSIMAPLSAGSLGSTSSIGPVRTGSMGSSGGAGAGGLAMKRQRRTSVAVGAGAGDRYGLHPPGPGY
jgi:hypothetical protein